LVTGGAANTSAPGTAVITPVSTCWPWIPTQVVPPSIDASNVSVAEKVPNTTHPAPAASMTEACTEVVPAIVPVDRAPRFGRFGFTTRPSVASPGIAVDESAVPSTSLTFW
jgi:hypothetical protein